MEDRILYVGDRVGMEKEILQRHKIPFKGIFCGKLRRYFSGWNLVDIFKLGIGFIQAFGVILRFRPDVVFSKGGYVSVPVVVAAGILRKRVIIHESDAIPGLATKIGARFAEKILVNFEEVKKYFPGRKVVRVGIPLRADLLKGSAEKGRRLTGFNKNLPVVLVMGGSLGAGKINSLIVGSLSRLLPYCQVVHVCGKGKMGEEEETSKSREGILVSDKKLSADFKKRYRAFEYLNEEMKDVYAISDLVVGRAGANALAEIKALLKPNIIIPLSRKVSRGDQIANAEIWEKKGYGVVLAEEELTAEKLSAAILGLLKNKSKREKMRKNMGKERDLEAAGKIREILI